MAGAVMVQGVGEQDLASQLEDALELLDSVSETFWSSKIREALGAIDPAQVLSWYGGMGSFNDLMIARVNGHHLPREQESAVNSRLSVLRRQIYELATRLKC
jgi:hypothetical protein